jgi:monoamine oxidase
MSEMVCDFAGEFIQWGETLEDKQNRLNAACSAWNIACNPPKARARLLAEYIKGYRSYNPDSTNEELSDIRSDMEKLVQKKLSLFPAIQKPIVGARISRVAGQDRIDVVSARIE